LLVDAQTRFYELVQRAHSEGPQYVTVNGHEDIVVISANAFDRLKSDQTGEALIAVMQASPHRDIEIEPARMPFPMRNLAL
jgi:prevent-host-death family protein